MGDRDPARAIGEHGLDRARGQLERVAVGLGEAHGGARALGVDDPRADVGVVVQARADDLVAGPERAPDRAGEGHRQRGHAEAEDDLRGRRAEQRAGARPRGRDELVGRVRGREDAAVVGAAARAHPRVHRLDRGVDHLRAGGAVEPRPAGVREAREALAVHSMRPAASRTSSASWGYVTAASASSGDSQRISSTSSLGLNFASLFGLHQPVAHDLGAALAVLVGRRLELGAEAAAQPDLLLDLAQRGVLPALALVELALGQRPVVVARAVHDHDLDAILAAPPHHAA